MKGKRWVCSLFLVLFVLPLAARADVVGLGPPPRNKASEAFVERYADGITGWDSAYDRALEGVEKIILWTYPNSGETTGYTAQWFEHDVKPSDVLGPCYRDGEGRFWGYINYIYGRRMSWICLSDPTNETLPADPEVVAAVDREVLAMTLREAAPAALLVAAVVLVTAGVIYVFWFKKKRR